MGLFIKRLLIFFAPFIILLSLSEYKLRAIPNSYKLKTNYLNTKSKSIETLILGSSHSFYGLNPEYFNSNTFNAGNVSQSPAIDLAILKSYEDQLPNLKNVAIRLSYDTLFEQLKNSSEDWRLKNYKLYANIVFDYSFKHSSEILSTGTRQALKTLKMYYMDKKPLLNCDSLGWGNDLKNKPKQNLYEAGLKVAEKHTAKNWDLLNDNVDNFNKILSWCTVRNIRVLIFTPPSYKSYADNLNNEQLTKMIEVGRTLALKYKNCEYVNFLKHEDFTAKDFYDADHLNSEGAKKFSLMVNSLIEN